MKRLKFTIDINAPKSKVWDVLWSDDSYRKWTSAFSEGSHAITNWEEGSQVWFLDSNKNGMWSLISKIIPEEQMIFSHQGVILDGVKQADSPESKEWKGATEEYHLKETNGTTTLTVEVDITDKYLDHFKETVPKALDNVQYLSEEI